MSTHYLPECLQEKWRTSWGFDGSLSWNDSPSQDLSYGVRLVGGYAKNRIRYWDEPQGAPEWQRSTGSPMNTGLYYVARGVFRDSTELMNYPHWVGARPGDIIFEDVDGDGAIAPEDLREELRFRTNAITKAFEETIEIAVRQVAEAGGYDLVLTSPVAYASDSIDITELILDWLVDDFASQ